MGNLRASTCTHCSLPLLDPSHYLSLCVLSYGQLQRMSMETCGKPVPSLNLMKRTILHPSKHIQITETAMCDPHHVLWCHQLQLSALLGRMTCVDFMLMQQWLIPHMSCTNPYSFSSGSLLQNFQATLEILWTVEAFL